MIRCDGVRPTCSNCVKRKMDCAFDEQARRRGPGKSKLAAAQEVR